MATTWHARIAWAVDTPEDPAVVLDILDALSAHSAVGSSGQDGLSGAVVLTVEADTITEGIASALALAGEAVRGQIPGAEIVAVDVKAAAAVERELEAPLFPEVVGYAEIAAMAGVSRQRVRKFPEQPGFPAPVIETAQGPLMPKAAVASWLTTRNTRPGPRGPRA